MTIEIKINDILVHTITDDEIKILKDKYPANRAGSEIAAAIIRRVNIDIKGISDRLFNEWIVDGKLAENGVSSTSTDRTTVLNTIFSQTNPELTHVYKDRDTRDQESE